MSPTRRAITLALAAMHAPPSLLTRSQLLNEAGAAQATEFHPILASLQASLGAAPASATMPVIAGDDRFVLALPTGFVASKRNAKQGTLYVAGDFPRFTIISVTAWPLSKVLTEEAASRALPGLPAAPPPISAATSGGIASLFDLGSDTQVAKLLLRARDREASSGSLESQLLTIDRRQSGSTSALSFSFSTPLPVSDPDALEKERGVRRLIRRTAALSTLGKLPNSNGGSEVAIFSVWGSCLEQDWDTGLGSQLQTSVDSFRVL